MENLAPYLLVAIIILIPALVILILERSRLKDLLANANEVISKVGKPQPVPINLNAISIDNDDEHAQEAAGSQNALFNVPMSMVETLAKAGAALRFRTGAYLKLHVEEKEVGDERLSTTVVMKAILAHVDMTNPLEVAYGCYVSAIMANELREFAKKVQKNRTLSTMANIVKHVPLETRVAIFKEAMAKYETDGHDVTDEWLFNIIAKECKKVDYDKVLSETQKANLLLNVIGGLGKVRGETGSLSSLLDMLERVMKKDGEKQTVAPDASKDN